MVMLEAGKWVGKLMGVHPLTRTRDKFGMRTNSPINRWNTVVAAVVADRVSCSALLRNGFDSGTDSMAESCGDDDLGDGSGLVEKSSIGSMVESGGDGVLRAELGSSESCLKEGLGIVMSSAGRLSISAVSCTLGGCGIESRASSRREGGLVPRSASITICPTEESVHIFVW